MRSIISVLFLLLSTQSVVEGNLRGRQLEEDGISQFFLKEAMEKMVIPDRSKISIQNVFGFFGGGLFLNQMVSVNKNEGP
jgi:hypothetical protein